MLMKQSKMQFQEIQISSLDNGCPEQLQEQIYNVVWQELYSGDCNIVMSHIHNIREKIEVNPSEPVYIQTVWGVGYRFNKNLYNGL